MALVSLGGFTKAPGSFHARLGFGSVVDSLLLSSAAELPVDRVPYLFEGRDKLTGFEFAVTLEVKSAVFPSLGLEDEKGTSLRFKGGPEFRVRFIRIIVGKNPRFALGHNFVQSL